MDVLHDKEHEWARQRQSKLVKLKQGEKKRPRTHSVESNSNGFLWLGSSRDWAATLWVVLEWDIAGAWRGCREKRKESSGKRRGTGHWSLLVAMVTMENFSEAEGERRKSDSNLNTIKRSPSSACQVMPPSTVRCSGSWLGWFSWLMKVQ